MTSTVDFEHGGRQEVDRRDDLAGMGSGSGSRPRWRSALLWQFIQQARRMTLLCVVWRWYRRLQSSSLVYHRRSDWNRHTTWTHLVVWLMVHGGPSSDWSASVLSPDARSLSGCMQPHQLLCVKHWSRCWLCDMLFCSRHAIALGSSASSDSRFWFLSARVRLAVTASTDNHWLLRLPRRFLQFLSASCDLFVELVDVVNLVHVHVRHPWLCGKVLRIQCTDDTFQFVSDIVTLF